MNERSRLISATTQVAEPRPTWWQSLMSQLTGRSLDLAVETDDVVETDPTGDSAPDTTSVDEELPTSEEPLEAELVEELPTPDGPELRPADEVELDVIDAEVVPDEPADVPTAEVVDTTPEVAPVEVDEITTEEPEPEPVGVVEDPDLIGYAAAVVTEPAVEEPTAADLVEEITPDDPTVVEPVGAVTTATPELETTESATPEVGTTELETTELESTETGAPEVAASTPETTSVEIEDIPCDDPRERTGPIGDNDDLTERWVDELRNGGHRQAHGTWENRGVFGGKSECTLQVAINTFDIPLGELRTRYGDRFIGQVLTRNDIERQSLEEIAAWIEKTQLSRQRQRELEMER